MGVDFTIIIATGYLVPLASLPTEFKDIADFIENAPVGTLIDGVSATSQGLTTHDIQKLYMLVYATKSSQTCMFRKIGTDYSVFGNFTEYNNDNYTFNTPLREWAIAIEPPESASYPWRGDEKTHIDDTLRNCNDEYLVKFGKWLQDGGGMFSKWMFSKFS